jgi:two-component system, response regulator YesN
MVDNEIIGATGKFNEGHPVSRLRILMVDDEKAIRGFFEAVATRFAPDIVGVFDSVGSGPEALERIKGRESEYDAIITDLRMPGMNGLDLAKEVGATAPNINLYAISGTMGIDLPEPEQYGFKGTLPKPASLEQVKTFLGQIHTDVFAPSK